VERRIIGAVARIRIGAALQQRLHGVELSPLDRGLQREAQHRHGHVRVGAVLQQGRDELRPSVDGDVKSGAPGRGSDVRVSTGAKGLPELTTVSFIQRLKHGGLGGGPHPFSLSGRDNGHITSGIRCTLPASGESYECESRQ
jgi:hypothetical protein